MLFQALFKCLKQKLDVPSVGDLTVVRRRDDSTKKTDTIVGNVKTVVKLGWKYIVLREIITNQ